MGVVYKAHDLKHGRLVALKFLPPGLTRNADLKRRFLREAKAAATLDHPCIGTVHDIGETDDGQSYIVMTFYDGETLKKKIARGPMGLPAALGTAAQIGRGLASAHKRGIVHGDVKPANILVTSDGTPKIVDFGLSILAGRPVIKKGGAPTRAIGYMSPEQLRGDAIDPRSDIWSLGVMLYEMLTGKQPFVAAGADELRYAILHSPSPRPSNINDEIPDELDEVVMQALRKDPRERYQKSDEFATTLESTRYLMSAGAWQSASRRFFTPFVRFQRSGQSSLLIPILLFSALAVLLLIWWLFR
jgi:serine/threonine-protein kinase